MVRREIIEAATKAALAESTMAAMCDAFQRVIPWETVEAARIARMRGTRTSRVLARVAE